MGLFNFLTSDIYILLEPYQITIKDIKSGAEITRSPIEPYSCGRMIISHYGIFEDFLKSVISELIPKRGVFAPSYRMYVEVKHNYQTPMSEIELRAIKDACEHAGAREVYLKYDGHSEWQVD